MGFRSYKLLTIQTITMIITMVPISPYPNIVVSLESENSRIQNPDEPVCTTCPDMDVPLGTELK